MKYRIFDWYHALYKRGNQKVSFGLLVDRSKFRKNTETDQHRCRYCKSEMEKGARFCVKCELFQGRFFPDKSKIGYYTLFNAGLSTIVLLVGFAVDRVQELPWFANSDLEQTGYSCFRDQAIVYITNKGRRIGVLNGGKVTASNIQTPDFDEKDNASFVSQTRNIFIEPDQAFIKKQSSGFVRLMYVDHKTSLRSEFPRPDEKLEQKCTYRFDIEYRDFRSMTTRALAPIINCSCASVIYNDVHKEDIIKGKSLTEKEDEQK